MAEKKTTKVAPTAEEIEALPWWKRILFDHPEIVADPTEDEPAFLKIFSDRGITEDVWRTRQYAPYGMGKAGVDTVTGYDEKYKEPFPSPTPKNPDRKDTHEGWLLKKTSQRPGIVMQRHTWKRKDGLRIFAQIRPFKFAELGIDVEAEYGVKDGGAHSYDDWHHHLRPDLHIHTDNYGMISLGPDTHHRYDRNDPRRTHAKASSEGGVLRFEVEGWTTGLTVKDPKTGGRKPNPNPQTNILTMWLDAEGNLRSNAVTRTKDGEYTPFVAPRADRSLSKKGRSQSLDEKRALQEQHLAGRDHKGVKPKEWVHEHLLDFTDHVQGKRHNGIEPGVRHNHPAEGKYLYCPNEETKIIDVHPLAMALLDEQLKRKTPGLVCYFALEGVLKNDAILSRDVPVFNAGSITLWNDPELPGFVETYLKDHYRVVVIVPDSDASGNDDVETASKTVMGLFHDWGMPNVVVGVPPAKRVGVHAEPDDDRICTEDKGCMTRPAGQGRMFPTESHKQGADDALGPWDPDTGSGGCDLNDFTAMFFEDEGIPALPKSTFNTSARYAPALVRDDNVLACLQRAAATSSGIWTGTYRELEQAVKAQGAPGAGKSHSAVGNAIKSWVEQGVLTYEEPSEWMLALGPEPRTCVRFVHPELLPIPKTMKLGDYLRRFE